MDICDQLDNLVVSTPPQHSLHLPQEMIEEIMSALPAKSLLRLRCVSKSWRSLIGSERFIKTQLEKSIKDPSSAHWRVVSNYDWYLKKSTGLTQFSVESYMSFLDEDEPIDQRPFDDSTNNHLTTKDCDVVGHCNGLLCIKKRGCFFLWNPTTRISLELPKIYTAHYYIRKYGFGMDEHSGAYKVFVGLYKDEDDDMDIGKIYSSETKSWKKVEHGCLQLGDDAKVGVLVGGKLHWLVEDGHYIESFNLSSEVFEMIELPYKKDEAKYYYLGAARGMLRLAFYDSDDCEKRGDEWVRVTKGGAKEDWVKVMNKREWEPLNILEYIGATVYVESLVRPISLKKY